MSNPRITFTPRSDATPEGELNALVAVYRFCLSRKNKEGGQATAPDDAMKGSKDDRARGIIPERS